MPVSTDIAILIGAYLIGGLSPGYWLVHWRRGIDVRTTGSGGTGATNVGRILGWKGYAVVMVFDVLKGALVGWVAQTMDLSKAWAFAAVLFAMVGHIWPVWLGFRGGKAVGPFIGAWLVLAPLALMPCLVLGLILLAWLRRFWLAGLCCLSVLPAGAWWATGSKIPVAAACITISLLLWSHRGNIRGFAASRAQAALASAAAEPTNPR